MFRAVPGLAFNGLVNRTLLEAAISTSEMASLYGFSAWFGLVWLGLV
jgi:hypothetical protein